jgi:hypothetical protein
VKSGCGRRCHILRPFVASDCSYSRILPFHVEAPSLNREESPGEPHLGPDPATSALISSSQFIFPFQLLSLFSPTAAVQSGGRARVRCGGSAREQAAATMTPRPASAHKQRPSAMSELAHRCWPGEAALSMQLAQMVCPAQRLRPCTRHQWWLGASAVGKAGTALGLPVWLGSSLGKLREVLLFFLFWCPRLTIAQTAEPQTPFV